MTRLHRAAFALFLLLGAALVIAPPSVRRTEAWLRYRLLGKAPPPVLVGRHGRLFLANHASGAPGALITAVCGSSVDDPAVARAAGHIRPVLAAARTAGVPVRFLIVPTAPRLYPEDLPPAYAHACDPPAVPAADRLVALLHDPAVVYPVPQMLALKAQFDVLPRKQFHWAGEGPLRVAEAVAERMGLQRSLTLPLRAENRGSDLNPFNPGMGAHSRIREPFLHGAGVAECAGARCAETLPDPIVAYSRPGPGRILVLGDSFGDELGQAFSEYAGLVWLVRMDLVVTEPPDPAVAARVRAFHPDAIVIVYHDDGALALDAASQISLAAVQALLANQSLRQATVSP